MTGWTSVEDTENVPEPGADIWVYSDGVVRPGQRLPGRRVRYWSDTCEYPVTIDAHVTHWHPVVKPEPPATALFVGCSDSKGDESAVITNEMATQDVVFDTAAMDG